MRENGPCSDARAAFVSAAFIRAFIRSNAAMRRKIGRAEDFLQVSCENRDPAIEDFQ
jgi:hypothetical protein